VRSADREALHTAAAVWKSVSFIPSTARRSRFGVAWPFAPKGPMSA
jgi:hypothetical protein